MDMWYKRTEILLGKKELEKLRESSVLVVGLGGVGSYAAEFLVRSGIGKLTIVDSDIVEKTNINRQIQALHSTIGKNKAIVLGKRLKDINPDLNLTIITNYLDENEIKRVLSIGDYDYVVDAIDTLTPKVLLIYHTLEKGYPLISAMGTGGKLDPTQIKIVDFSQTYGDKFARHLRKKLHKLGIYSGFKAVFSAEPIKPCSLIYVNERNKKTSLGTIVFVPALFGLYCSYTVINDIINLNV